MTTHIEVTAGDTPATIHLQDGSTVTVEPHGGKGVDLAEFGYCTIREMAAPAKEGDEDKEEKSAFAQKAADFWKGTTKAWDELVAKAKVPAPKGKPNVK